MLKPLFISELKAMSRFPNSTFQVQSNPTRVGGKIYTLCLYPNQLKPVFSFKISLILEFSFVFTFSL